MNKLSFNHKVEIEILKVKEYEMAVLVARRLHNFCKTNESLKGKGITFMVTNNYRKNTISIASTKLNQLEPRDVYTATRMGREYMEQLKPFFTKR